MMKSTGIFPDFMKVTNICAIYKDKGEVIHLDSYRGIYLVTIFRTILMKMIYEIIGARKMKNIRNHIRNHIFVVNSIMHDVLSKKTKSLLISWC